MLGGVSEAAGFGISIVTPDDVEGLQNDRDYHAINQQELKGTDKELVATNVADNAIKHHPTNDVAHHVEQGRNPIVIADASENASRFLVGAAQSGRRFFPNWRLTQILNRQFRLRQILRWSSEHERGIS